ncbi:MAG: glutamate-5-semialdehyde dehydrogenase [Patescibacteria group bacterium]
MNKPIQKIGKRARVASREFSQASNSRKNAVLKTLAGLIQKNESAIIRANREDIQRQGENHPLSDRLMLNPKRLKFIRKSLLAVIQLPDPVGEITENFKQPNGLHILRVRVPIGVMGVIYESRPNVTVEISSLALKAGNAVILKGGKEANSTNKIFVSLIQRALEKNGFSKFTVQFLDAPKKSMIVQLLRLNEYIDVLIPRGSRRLIDFVRANASVPVIETGAGVCHTYVEKTADIIKSAIIIENAKTQRPTVCNALDTLVLDHAIAPKLLPQTAVRLKKHQVLIKADPASYRILQSCYPKELLQKAKKNDFGKEFLGLQMSVKTIKNFTEAISFIQEHTSGHSEAVLTKDKRVGKKFLEMIDAAAVYVNTSTRFTDGFQFGLGAEVGISTQKLHARGPIGLKELTSIKWIVNSNWKIRN